MTLDRSRLRSRARAARRDREAARALAWSAMIATALVDNRPSLLERLRARIRRLLGRG